MKKPKQEERGTANLSLQLPNLFLVLKVFVTYCDIPCIIGGENIARLIEKAERGFLIGDWLPDLHPDGGDRCRFFMDDKQVPLHQATGSIDHHLQQVQEYFHPLPAAMFCIQPAGTLIKTNWFLLGDTT